MTFFTSFYNSLLLSMVLPASKSEWESPRICGYAGSCWKLAKSHVIFPLTSQNCIESPFLCTIMRKKSFRLPFFRRGEERFLIKMPMWMPILYSHTLFNKLLHRCRRGCDGKNSY
jgi:hypothetical protein